MLVNEVLQTIEDNAAHKLPEASVSVRILSALSSEGAGVAPTHSNDELSFNSEVTYNQVDDDDRKGN